MVLLPLYVLMHFVVLLLCFVILLTWEILVSLLTVTKRRAVMVYLGLLAVHLQVFIHSNMLFMPLCFHPSLVRHFLLAEIFTIVSYCLKLLFIAFVSKF